MADRTLRRAYPRNDGVTQSDASAVSGNAGNESERIDGEQNTDSSVDGNGNDAEPNTERDSSSVRIVEIDPDKLGDYVNGNGGDSDSGEPRKRRGRKPGGKNRTGAKKAQETVEPFLLMAHQWAAVLLKTPEIALTSDEAKQLSDAYSNFCEYHEVPILSPKRMSEINMIAAMFVVYGPRFVAVRNRLKEERKVKAARNVTPIQGVM